MSKDWIMATVGFVIIGMLAVVLVVLLQPPAQSKPSTSDVMTCEIDKAGGFHPDPCPAN